MGLDILTAQLNQLRKNQAAANNVGWLFNIANLLCLEEFLLLLFSLGVLKAFKEALDVMIVAAAAQIALLQVVIAQLEAANSVLATFVGVFKSALDAAKAKLSQFPFGSPEFQQCPIVQAVEQYMVSLLPASANPLAKIYKQSLGDINEMQYRIYRNGKYIQQLNQKIAQLQASVLAWQAIVNAIAAQFGV